jgi:hypothetical protein
MDHHLTAVRDFGSYKRGDHIDDEAEVARILGGEHSVHVVKVVADAKPVDMPVLTNGGESGSKTLTMADLPAAAK